MYSVRLHSFFSRKFTGIAINYILKYSCNKIVVNPRYFENTFILKHLDHFLDPAARVLDIGSAESELPLYLHASGYEVTAFDQRNYPFIQSITGDAICLMDFIDPQSYDAITAVSTIEHIGIGAYGDNMQSISYLDLLNTWKQGLKNNGYLLITLPVTSETKRREKGQWVENLKKMNETLDLTGGTIKAEKLVIQNSDIPMQWEEIPVKADNKFNLGVYMVAIQY